MNKFLVSAAILSAAIASAPASAQTLLGPSVKVSVKDLDLRAAEGRATLRARVDSAIDRVCPVPEIGLFGMLERGNCVRDVAARAHRAMSVAIARANPGAAPETFAAR